MKNFFTMALKTYAGYKLKSISLFIFITLSFTIILGTSTFLFQTIENYWKWVGSFAFPYLFVSGVENYDLDTSDATIKKMTLKSEQKELIEVSFSDRFSIYEGLIITAFLRSKSRVINDLYSLLYAFPFEDAKKIFSVLEEQVTSEELLRFKEENKVLVSKVFADRRKITVGEVFVVLGKNYDGNITAMKFTVGKIFDQNYKRTRSDTMGFPIIYLDIDAAKKFMAIPESKSTPLFMIPKKGYLPLFYPESRLLLRNLKKTLHPEKIYYTSLATMLKDMSGVFDMFQVIVFIIIVILVIIVIFSASSNIYISFLNRKTDFGVLKSFGATPRDLFILASIESLIGLCMSLLLSFLLIILLGKIIGGVNISGVIATLHIMPLIIPVMIGLAVFVHFASLAYPFQYIKKLSPVDIMKDD